MAAISLLGVVGATANQALIWFWYGIFPVSIMTPFAVVGLTTWVLMAVGAMGLLRRRRWGFVLIYIAAVLNLLPGYFWVLDEDRMIMIFPFEVTMPLVVCVFYLLFMVVLVWIHVRLWKIGQLL